jgi:hypothetical protein
MSTLETIRDLAKQTLTVATLPNGLDNYLWDRAHRLLRNVEHICQLPELTKSGSQIDHFCLVAATYFSDAGLVSYLEKTDGPGKLPTANEDSNGLLEFSADIAEEKLAGAVEQARVEKISRIITESGSRFTKMVEAMILSDARSLDDMGATGIFNEFRRGAVGGKSVGDAVQSWKRKIDYKYWQARLKEGFRFEAVRKLAERRLQTAEQFMRQLEVENAAEDLEELLVNSVFT